MSNPAFGINAANFVLVSTTFAAGFASIRLSFSSHNKDSFVTLSSVQDSQRDRTVIRHYRLRIGLRARRRVWKRWSVKAVARGKRCVFEPLKPKRLVGPPDSHDTPHLLFTSLLIILSDRVIISSKVNFIAAGNFGKQEHPRRGWSKN